MPASEPLRAACGHARALLHLDVLQEQRGAEIGADEGSEAVEGLAESQPEMASFGTAERRGKRVGGDLKHRDPAGQHEQPKQHDLVDGEVRGEQHDQAPRDHHRQRQKHGVDRLEPRQKDGARQAHHAVSDEESRSAQLRFDVGQMEDAFDRGDQRVDQRGGESPREE